MKQTLNILLFSVAMIFLAAVIVCGHDKIEVSSTPVASTIPSQNPCIKVFIENSGSMDGYMCDGSQLNDVVYDYVSDVNRVSSKNKERLGVKQGQFIQLLPLDESRQAFMEFHRSSVFKG